jgi:hypothetical protein
MIEVLMSENKNCRVCKIEKEQLAFKKSKYYKSGYSTICKECSNAERRLYSKRPEVKERKKAYLATEKGKQSRKKTIVKYYRTKVKNRLKSDENFRIAYNLRTSIAHVTKQKGFYKKSKLKYILGCDLNFLKNHLKQTFVKNYGREITEFDCVEIDHVIPISSAQTVEELYKLNHFSNLQFLLRSDNRKKSAKMEFEINV